MLVISNRPCATRSADLKLLARLLPELYFTQSNYYYQFVNTRSVKRIIADGDEYSSFPRRLTFLGNYADQCIRLAHIFCSFQMR